MLQERAAEALRSGALQTYKQQISFGLHVIVMMGTFYAVGHIAGTALSPRMAVVFSHCDLSSQSSQLHLPTFCSHAAMALSQHLAPNVCMTESA